MAHDRLWQDAPFLTTLVVLIIVRAAYNKVTAAFTEELASISSDNSVWDFMGGGTILGVPTNMAVLIVVAIATHFFLTGRVPACTSWQSARAEGARHAGVNVKWALFSAYVISGTLTALAGIFYAARQNSSGPTPVAAGNQRPRRGRSRRHQSRRGAGNDRPRDDGAAIIFMLISGLVQTGVSGNFTTAIIGIILLVAVGFNVKWVKNKSKVLQKVYVVPSWVDFQPPPSIARDSGTVFAETTVCATAEAIALNQIEGPEDIILDRRTTSTPSTATVRSFGSGRLTIRSRRIRPHRRPAARPCL